MPISTILPRAVPTIGPEAKTKPLLPIELQQWLEWSGSKLLSLQTSSPLPKGPNSAWPEFASDAQVAYGYSGERLRPATPNSVEIELMDKILAFPSLIKDINTRKIVNARAMVAPISFRYLYSWRKIAFMLHTSPDVVKRQHARGLDEIVPQISKEKTYAIRLLIGSSAHSS